MSIDTVTLQCFLAVTETLSFTKAALKVGRTQSAISQQIAKLENLIEKPLITRGRELKLTSDGEIFLTYAKQIYTLHRETLDRFKAPELEGELCFGLPEDYAWMMLSDVLVEFSRLHPRISMKVECDLTLNLLERFKRGEFDLILIKTNEKNTIFDGTNIWNEPVDWVGKTRMLSNFNEQMSIPLVLSPSPCVYRVNVIEALEKEHLDWRLVFSSPSYSGKMAAVRAGLGITAIQRSLIPPDLEQLNYDFLPPLNDLHVSLLKKEKVSKAVDSLEYFIMDKLRH